jgi:hypothetical protein
MFAPNFSGPLSTGLKVVLKIQSYQLSIIGSEWEESMKTQHIVALAVTAGFGLGAIAVEGLHAQAAPPAYVVSELNVTNPDGFDWASVLARRHRYLLPAGPSVASTG